MRINHNMQAMNTQRQMNSVQNAQAKSMEKLSSGYRINNAGDDAAGLTISEKMRGQIKGLDQASRNAQDGISMIQTAEGALNETHSILQRMRELSVQAGNDTLVTDDRKAIGSELTQLEEEITRIGNQTNFNTKTLLNGSQSTGVTLQIGANAGETVTFSMADMRAGASLVNVAGIGSGVGSATAASLASNITTINTAIKNVSTARSSLGATQNRLEHTISNLDTGAENLQASESRIRDVDMATEMMEFTKNNILSQAAQSMLSQANQAPQSVLQLLQ